MKIVTPEFIYYYFYYFLGVVYPITSGLWVLAWSNWRRRATPEQITLRYSYMPNMRPRTTCFLALGLFILMLSIHTGLLLWNMYEIEKGLGIAWVGLAFNCLGIFLVLQFPVKVALRTCKRLYGRKS